MIRHLLLKLACAAISVSLITSVSGCSLLIAQADEETDLSGIDVGSDRKVVEARLGKPKGDCESIRNETYCHYAYEYGCKDRMERGDDVQIIAANIVTFGLFELFATPAAMVMCGIEGAICFAYDSDNKVVKYGLVDDTIKDMPCSGQK